MNDEVVTPTMPPRRCGSCSERWQCTSDENKQVDGKQRAQRLDRTRATSVPKDNRRNKLLAMLLPDNENWARHGSTNPTACRQVESHLIHMWADSTWKGYAGVWGRYTEWCLENSLEVEFSSNACIWIVETGISLQGQHQYAKVLHALMKRFGFCVLHLSLMAAGMRHQGALIPISQAKAITQPELEALLADSRVGDSLKLGMMLAWSTASRWDDITHLTESMCIDRSPERLIISWGDKTKTSRADPFRASAYVDIRGRYVQEIQRLIQQTPQQQEQLVPWSTAALDTALKKWGYPWSGHSFKRGAANHLVQAAAEGRLNINLLPQLLKHKSAMDFNATTIRYVSDHVALAIALGTGHATRLL